MRVDERFLKYISYWTTSDEKNESVPSSEREFELAKVLEEELKDLGLSKVTLTDHCYVYGLLPATSGMENTKSIGLIAHMDTAPDYCGKNIKPQIIPNYDGKDVALSDSGLTLKITDFPDLLSAVGKTLITTDGTTLLGADDKAGIAEIITAIEYIIDNNIPHGDIWIGFTPDEEVGNGPQFFDLNYFKADYAYTVDGDYEGEIAYENFNAASAEFEIQGVNVHPGEAKNIMVNAALIATELAQLLPCDQTPSHTEGREGFFHLTEMEGNVAFAKLSYIIRDHDSNIFESRLNKLRTLQVELNQKYGSGTVSLRIQHSYENMLSVIENKMHVVDLGKKAISSVGLTPISRPIRGEQMEQGFHLWDFLVLISELVVMVFTDHMNISRLKAWKLLLKY